MGTIKTQKKENLIPALAMRGLVIFPAMILHFDVERAKSIAALEEAMDKNRRILLVTQKDIEVDNPKKADLYKTGVVAEIKQLLSISRDTIRVLVEGLYKVKISDVDDSKPYLEASITRINVSRTKVDEKKQEALMRSLKKAFMAYIDCMPKMSKDAVNAVVSADTINTLFDAVIESAILQYQDRQALLEINNIALQCEKLVEILISETEVLSLEKSIIETAKDNMEQNHQEYFLREQMKAIAEQLGENETTQDEAATFEAQIEEIKNMPDSTKEKLYKECERLYKSYSSSQESNVIRNYIETCLSLPWDTFTKDKLEISKVKKALDKDHYGMKKIKDRILESLSVRKLNPEIKGQILCLVGPPGVGKTSIGKAIAQAIGRRYVRISLGGVRDESDIRGHRKTYVGAMAGRIINAYIQAKSRNPLILLDEIDKMSNDFRGDPSAAMLEVLDGEQNNTFRDHYIEVPFDLSETLFVTTANSLDTIPEPLLDRMEIIELSSYTREEKFNIAKKHLVKKQRIKHGLTANQIKIQDSVIYDIIDHYTREAGVRKLELKLAELCRKTAKLIAEDKKTKVSISENNIKELLGPRKYKTEQVLNQDEVGVVNGLAWTSVGGELLKIEAQVVAGTGKVEITGNLGNVMNESAKLAVTYARSIAKEYSIENDFYKNCDIHIHAPEGAVPKDGPSAGVTISTALISALTDMPVKRDIAMTGEISLRGKVMPIGGLKEKTMAAYRAGVKTVLIPEDNVSDLAEVDDVVKNAIEFIPCNNLRQVLDHALIKTSIKRNNILIPKENITESENVIRS